MSQQVCVATTKLAAPCRSFALPNRETCVMHSPDLQPAVHAARQRGGTAAAKLRLLQGKRLKLDSPRALVRFLSGLIQDGLAGTVDLDLLRGIAYTVSVQLKATEQAQNADVEAMLSEVRQLTAEARMRGRA